MNIKFAIEEIERLLLRKQADYGDSIGNPVKIFASGDSTSLLRARIDDKLSRLKMLSRSNSHIERNTILDLAGYIVLLLANTPQFNRNLDLINNTRYEYSRIDFNFDEPTFISWISYKDKWTSYKEKEPAKMGMSKAEWRRMLDLAMQGFDIYVSYLNDNGKVTHVTISGCCIYNVKHLVDTDIIEVSFTHEDILVTVK